MKRIYPASKNAVFGERRYPKTVVFVRYSTYAKHENHAF